METNLSKLKNLTQDSVKKKKKKKKNNTGFCDLV